MAHSRPRWWSRRGIVAIACLPFAALFGLLSALRRIAYRTGLLRSVRLPVKVVVVGNIAVGGSGKTPVVLWLAAGLQRRGFKPGILSRGYGGTTLGPMSVNAGSSPETVGDEPVLLARRAGVPVWVGRDRVEAGRALLQVHPEVNVLITDDGLQHYRLRRDVEIIVVDEAVLGNRWLLPAGPLREGSSRLRTADIIVSNGAMSQALMAYMTTVPVEPIKLISGAFYRLDSPGERRMAQDFGKQPLHAIAGIGLPERFFRTLAGLGLNLARTNAFPDHHRYSAADLAVPPGTALLMTEKDAVKCSDLAPNDSWVLPVEADIDERALDIVLERLHGSQAA